MDLKGIIPKANLILGIAERIRNKYPNPNGACELMAKDLVKALTRDGIYAKHVVGNFRLDEPDAEKYMACDDWDNQDEYNVNHDWVEIEGKILDISASQFKKSVYENIPDIVYIDYKSPLYIRYERVNYYGGK
jgi:hypothetical protein